ncbi:DNA-binding response regulator [Xylocopilactobacillus apicola]|uniref:DNA-binding response regulator n=1 Tax=Xylocopilactobacillus apicola TaxID=2932184 RepID=A0AAU9DPK9_9LACO|nr:DNA-binding response regulator [Xylocopilactobacillus apicola]BDR57739.1 DNA-binding response regulator [Xylocopilactobacillus apicola]
MYPIYILEDNLEQQKAYANAVKNSIMINDLAMELICATDDPEILLNSIEQEHQGLFFLDMEINGIKEIGLQTAVLIRKQLPGAQIVFITTHNELSLLTLERKVAPLNYISKEYGADYIKQSIMADMLKTEELIKSEKYKKENLFIYRIGSHYFSIPIADLVYLTTADLPANSGRVSVRTVTKNADFHGNLSDLEKKYPMFFRCDKSYLVNLDMLESFDNSKRELYFRDGSTAYASFRKARELAKILKK